MKEQYERTKEKSFLAISQIALMILGIVAISYVIGSNFETVSAQETGIPEVNEAICAFDKEDSYVRVDNVDEQEWCQQNGCSLCAAGPKGSCSVIKDKEKCNDLEFNSPEVSTATIPRPGVRDILSAEEAFRRLQGDDDDPDTPEDEPETGDGAPGLLSVEKFSSGKNAVARIVGNAAIALGIWQTIRWVGGALGANPDFANALGRSAAATYFTTTTLVPALNTIPGITIGTVGALGIGVGVGVVLFFTTYREQRYDLYAFSCLSWDAPTGGEHCEVCNQGEIPCTEYRCRTLGQQCELVNKGTTQEQCVFVDRLDPNPPVIEPWEDVLNVGYSYIPDNAVSPPNRGVEIVRDGEERCVQPFKNLTFGIELNQPARCKITPERADSFENMQNTFFGSSSGRSLYNHSTEVRIPSPQALEAEGISLRDDGNFRLYVRCENAAGNSNVADFTFSFCVDDGPDTQEPVIELTSIGNNSPIGYEQNSVDLSIFVDEPAECSWDHLDKSFEDMTTPLTCATSVTQVNARGLYQCSTTLTGLNDRVDNDFFFRCKDKPYLANVEGQEGERIENQQSYLFRLKGTQPLVIDSVGPNETISDSTDVIKVTLEAETSAGYNQGDATCSYQGFGTNGFYNDFQNTGSHEHSQSLFLPEGSYDYNIRCTDLGGNSDEETVSFEVESDTQSPIVVRIFRQSDELKILTNEDASCVYDTVDCSYEFESGERMSTTDDRLHVVEWNSDRNFYIKCEDEFGNRPNPNKCSIEARPFEF